MYKTLIDIEERFKAPQASPERVKREIVREINAISLDRPCYLRQAGLCGVRVFGARCKAGTLQVKSAHGWREILMKANATVEYS